MKEKRSTVIGALDLVGVCVVLEEILVLCVSETPASFRH